MKNKFAKEFIRYVGANICSMIGLSCYILADTYFIANGVGLHGMAALNLAIPIFGFMTAVSMMVGTGTACKWAIYKGQGKEAEGNAVFYHGFLFAILCGLLFLAAGLFGAEPLALIMGADEVTKEAASIYLRTFLCFAPFFMCNQLFYMMVKNDGAPKLAMAAMLIGSFLNIVLDYVFIYYFHMGMFGAAFATGLSPVTGLLILSIHKKKKRHSFYFQKTKSQLHHVNDILRLGVPACISEVAAAVIVIAFNMVMLKYEGNIGVAAYGIIANLALVVMGMFNGIAQGIQPIVSRSYAESGKESTKKAFRWGMATATCLAVLVYCILFLNARSVADLFNQEGDKGLRALAVPGIRIYFAGILFAGWNVVAIYYYSAIEAVKVSFVTSLVRSGVLLVPLLLLLSSLFGITGIWLSYPLAEGIIACVMVLLARTVNERRGKR